MQWVKNYQLFLFDFDGLLVNTEEMHYKAYQRMLHQNGFELHWSFNRYCEAAHYEASALKDQIYHEFPALFKKEPDWTVLYKQKQANILDLIEEGLAHLMPGVAPLLKSLSEHNIPRVVVTHSPDQLIQLVRKQNPLLDTIPHWITREHYKNPKPDPECYFTAIKKFSKPGDRIIGFEDTPRGLRALMETPAEANLICTADYPEIPDFLARGAKRYTSLAKLSQEKEKEIKLI